MFKRLKKAGIVASVFAIAFFIIKIILKNAYVMSKKAQDTANAYDAHANSLASASASSSP